MGNEMKQIYRDLRYIRVAVKDLGTAKAFATDVFGLQLSESDDDNLRLRSDARNYSLCYSQTEGPDAVALSVAGMDDLENLEVRLANWKPMRLTPDECAVRQVKAGLSVKAPNGILVEIVWRPLTAGWRYHGPRDAGIVELQSVQLACTDIAANEEFWVHGMGANVSDWVGDAAFLQIDDAHHRIALYPSKRDEILGVVWAVEDINNVMQGWYHFQSCQVPIVHGPGRQAPSEAIFVTAAGPGDIYYSYATGLDAGDQIAARGPRQFADAPLSHCAWGSHCTADEFTGVADHD